MKITIALILSLLPLLVWAQDYDFAARVTGQFNIAVTAEVLLQYRAHKGQVSQTPNLKQFGFADEVRTRLLSDLGVEIDFDVYHKWVLEADATKGEFRECVRILKTITEKNLMIASDTGTGSAIYNQRTLQKTIW